MKNIVATILATLAVLLGASACQSAAPPAGDLGQETKKGLPTPGTIPPDLRTLRTAVVVAAVEICANRPPPLPFTRRRMSSKRDGQCLPLRAIQNVLADCGLNGLSPRNDSCGTLGFAGLFGSLAFGLHGMNDVVILAQRAKDCADGKGFCDAMQTVQTLVDCGLKAATPDACDQVIAEAQERMIQVSAKMTNEDGVSTAVELAKACAEEGYKDNKRHCRVLQYMQKAIVDCDPPTDACGRAYIRREDLRTFATMTPAGGVASIAKACAEENDKDACNAVQSIQALADCGLKPYDAEMACGESGCEYQRSTNACDQPIAEAKAQWPSLNSNPKNDQP